MYQEEPDNGPKLYEAHKIHDSLETAIPKTYLPLPNIVSRGCYLRLAFPFPKCTIRLHSPNNQDENPPKQNQKLTYVFHSLTGPLIFQ